MLGVLGRAQRLHPVEISAFFVASNHYHILAWVPDAESMADFMGYFQTNVAREVGRLRKWRDKIWSRRYEAIVISDEPAAQVDRLRYVLSKGCIPYCTSFQDLVLEIPAERFGRVRSGQSAGTS